MNILYISHCNFTGNSAMHIFSIANHVAAGGAQCAVCVPDSPETLVAHGTPQFRVLDFETAEKNGVSFPDGRGPDLIHAWTPRELVRKLALVLSARYDCRYLVHLEDNEEIILENELPPQVSLKSLKELDANQSVAIVPEHRSHPVHSITFLANAVGITVLMDPLLEFKPDTVPGIIFWPGFDESFADQSIDNQHNNELRIRLNLDKRDCVIVYNGNIHASNRDEVRSLYLAVGLLNRRGYPVKVVKTGWNYEDPLDANTRALKDHIVDLGFVARNEIPALIALSDILVQPGGPNRFNDYRFPSKLPEYLVSGKPVILPKTNIGRFLRDGEEALLLREGHALEIVEKLETLLKDPGLRKKIGLGGRQFALENLQWSKNVKRIEKFYENLLQLDKKQIYSESKEASQKNIINPVSIGNTNQSANGEFPVLSQPRLVAFYLPQFHPIKENDEWWGKGFTEWTNVVRAKPLFTGHHQPQLPTDLGFYDLRAPEVLEEQARIAASYGISGFCFYYYWFNGKRLLEKPLEALLESKTPDFPFCICWANENWTRRWDGSEDEILIRQKHSPESDAAFIHDVIPVLKDRRYITVQGRPVLLIYRINLFPDPASTARIWREMCAAEGIKEIHLCAVQSFGITDPRPYGFDAAVEFPPHMQRALVDPNALPGIAPDFAGYLEDYEQVVQNQIAKPRADYLLYRGVMPAWDNTARRGKRAHIIYNASPEKYETWLRAMLEQERNSPSKPDNLMFVNAWNEWAEGNHLEPDDKHGYAYLEATRRALNNGDKNLEGSLAGKQSKKQALQQGQKDIGIGAGEQTSANKKKRQKTHKTSQWLDDAQLQRIYKRYQGNFSMQTLSYATVRDFCDSIDHLGFLAQANGDLKDCQRPWVLKAILSKLPRGSRILEIGAGEPFVADILDRLGYAVWIVDPYDGSGNGPRGYEQFKEECPNITFVRSHFSDTLNLLAEHSFDCIYSISVLEHVQPANISGVFAGIKRFLKPDGFSIHAVDHVHRGNGATEHLNLLTMIIEKSGMSAIDLTRLLESMAADTETYYLSAESHNRWRAGLPYADFPMRICVSIQIVHKAQYYY